MSLRVLRLGLFEGDFTFFVCLFFQKPVGRHPLWPLLAVFAAFFILFISISEWYCIQRNTYRNISWYEFWPYRPALHAVIETNDEKFRHAGCRNWLHHTVVRRKCPTIVFSWLISTWFCLSWIGLGIVQRFSIPIHWVRYLFLSDTFFNTNFIKSVLTRLHYLKNVGLICSACWHLYRLKVSSPEPPHKGTKYIQHKSVQIVLIKFKVSVRLPLH